MKVVINWVVEDGDDRKYCILQQGEFESEQVAWEKKIPQIVHKYVVLA